MEYCKNCIHNKVCEVYKAMGVLTLNEYLNVVYGKECPHLSLSTEQVADNKEN